MSFPRKKETGEKMDSLYVKGLVFLTTSLPGDRSDPISKCVDIIIELIAPLKNQIQGIALIVIIASAAVWMCPFFEKEWKRKANKWILGLIGGAIILAGAAEYAAYISERVKF